MNGVLVIKKIKGITSRDVVNQVSRILNTKRIGHTGTLDPMAIGVMVLCIGSSLKLVEMLTNHDKEYIARVKLGIETDTLDITGTVVKSEENVNINKVRIEQVLETFVGKIRQEVPIYSSVKVRGKKLYEYARRGERVELPVREVQIYDLKLIGDIKDDEFTIKCHVSKGTYIRSLVRDIGYALGSCATMVQLERTRLGDFSLDDAYSIEDIEKGNFKLLSPIEVLDLPKVMVDDVMEKKIRNGQILPSFFDSNMAFILNKDDILLAIYQKYNHDYVKPYRMF